MSLDSVKNKGQTADFIRGSFSKKSRVYNAMMDGGGIKATSGVCRTGAQWPITELHSASQNRPEVQDAANGPDHAEKQTAAPWGARALGWHATQGASHLAISQER